MTESADHNDATRQVQVLKPGSRIGRYELVRRLGAGGMGEVYLAQDTLLRRQVALKFLMPHLVADASFKERFLREARSAAALNHPNIVTIYEVGDHDGYSFIAMEFIEGSPLSELVGGGGVEPAQIVGIVLQICAGLEAAHRAGLVHRDIKPANILLGSDNRVRILDFGLAKSNSDQQLTQQGMAIGTVQYMSPEQAQSKELDRRSDLFSLGVVIYELLAGKSPFRKDQPMSTMYAIINEEPPRLALKEQSQSDFWQSILDRLLAKNVADRFDSAASLSDAVSVASGPSTTSLTAIPAQAPRTRALAVLYLRNMGQPDDEFIGYGITEDLIVDLSRIGSLRVAPMRSILRFKDSDADLKEIAEQLDVSMVLDGSIMRMGDHIRVSANLVEIQSNQSLWAERWEESFTRLPQIKTALAEGVSAALQVTHSQVEVLRVGAPDAQDHTAYEQYLRAKYLFEHKQDSSDVDIAMGLYKEALRREGGLIAAQAGLAEILSYQGQYPQALQMLQQSVQDAEEHELKPEQAAIRRLLAETYRKMSRWEEAWEQAEAAKSIYESLNDLAGESETLSTMISILQPQSRYDEILELFDRLLEIAREQDDKEKTADALKTMGVVYARRGEYDNALSLYEESMQMAVAKKNLALQAACLSNIGNVEFFRRDHEAAAEYYRKSRDLYDKIGDKAGSTRQLLNEGTIHYIRADYAKAAERFKEAVDDFERVDNKSSLSLALLNLSQTKLQLGEIESASRAARRALELGTEIRRPLVECDGHLRLGDIALLQGDLASAEESYEQALAIAEDHSFTRNAAYIHLAMADLFYLKNNFTSSASAARNAKRAAKEVDEKSIMQMATAYGAAASCRKGLVNAALRELRGVVQEFGQQPDRAMEIRAKSLLADALIFCGGTEERESEGHELFAEITALAERLNLKLESRRLQDRLDPDNRQPDPE